MSAPRMNVSSRPGSLRVQGAQRVDGVGRSGAAQLQLGDLRDAGPRDGEPAHGQAVLGAGIVLGRLVRGTPTGMNSDPFQPEL